VTTQWGPVTVKEGIYNGIVVQRSPEFEECKTIARHHNVPLKKIYEQVWQRLGQE
jgi:pyridinium-3,5-bisthiocarboxylic acid mononucleotide nickel chelatase